MSKKKQEKAETKSDVLQRLAQASVEGLAIEVAMNTIIPGSGLAVHGLNQGKNIKKAAKIMLANAIGNVFILSIELSPPPTKYLQEAAASDC